MIICGKLMPCNCSYIFSYWLGSTFSIIVTQVPSGTSVTAKDLADIVMGNYEQQFPNFALVDSGPTQLSGNSAFQKTYSATLAGIDVQGTNVFYVFGDKAYMVQYIVDKAKASQYMPIIQKMLDSLVVDQGMMPVEFSNSLGLFLHHTHTPVLKPFLIWINHPILFKH